MHKKLILALLFISYSAVHYSQEKIKGNKVVTIVETEVSAFNKIIANEKFTFSLVKSDTPAVEVETDENLHDVIEFRVKDSTLIFKTTKRITSKKKLNINIKYADKLIGIETKDNADFSAVSAIECDALTLKTYGNSRVAFNLVSQKFNLINGEKAKVNLNIESSEVNLDLNESSKIEALVTTDSLSVNIYKNATAILDGSAKHLNIEALDSSNLKCKNLSVETCDVVADNSSDISIKVSDALKLNASGNSEIQLYEEPKITIETFANSTRLIKKEL